MNPILTDDQSMLVDSVRRLLADRRPVPAYGRELRDQALKALWRECAEMGWLQALVPEAGDGLGLHVLDAALMAEEMGRNLLAIPVSDAMAVAAFLAGLDTGRDGGFEALVGQWLRGNEYYGVVIDSVYAHGGASNKWPETGQRPWADYAVHGGKAMALRWSDGQLTISLHEAADVGHGIDSLIATAPVSMSTAQFAVQVDCPVAAWRNFCNGRRLMRLAELLGTGSKALEEAAAYARERQQFGKSIGVNQAVKHRLADNWMALDNARLALHDACCALDRQWLKAALTAMNADSSTGSSADSANADNVELSLLMAELLTLEASTAATTQAVQTFGAMGITWECPAHLYLKRAKHISATLRIKHDSATILEKIWMQTRPQG